MLVMLISMRGNTRLEQLPVKFNRPILPPSLLQHFKCTPGSISPFVMEKTRMSGN